MKIQVLADADAVAKAGAEVVAEAARSAVATRGRCSLALSGGRTPWLMLRALVDQEVPWRQVEIFQVDERVAPADSPERNLKHLRESLLARVPLPPDNLHPMPVEESDLAAAAASYARTLEAVAGTPPALDLVHLGLGPDGHTASLVPGRSGARGHGCLGRGHGGLPAASADDADLSGAEPGARDPVHRHRRRQGGCAGAPVQARPVHPGRPNRERERDSCWPIGRRQRGSTPRREASPMKVLVIDIGGSHVKIMATGHRKERQGGIRTGDVGARHGGYRARSGRALEVQARSPWAIPVRWCTASRCSSRSTSRRAGSDSTSSAAFGRRVKVVNDALMQAVGSYEGGRMLFLGLGTGLGSAMVVENVAQPMELAHLPYKDGRTFEEYLGEAALEQMGQEAWQKEVAAVVARLQAALEPEYVVLGGGNVRLLEELPPGCRRGDNTDAFAAAFACGATTRSRSDHSAQALLQGRDGALVILAVEDERAGDEQAGARGGREPDGVGPDAAVHLDRDVPARRFDPRPNLLDHRQLLGHEPLAAEAGMDRHDQDHVDVIEVVIDRLGRRPGAEAEAGPAACSCEFP